LKTEGKRPGVRHSKNKALRLAFGFTLEPLAPGILEPEPRNGDPANALGFDIII
jgi:hypothetical protein